MQKRKEEYTYKTGDLIRFGPYQQFTYEIKRDQILKEGYIVPVAARAVKPFKNFTITLPAPSEDLLFYYSPGIQKYVIKSAGRHPMYCDEVILIRAGVKA